LNDEWSSHPTWESEDAGFVAHRKNAFEDVLHRIEEERHDYDSNIEALERTIQLVEPHSKALKALSPDAQKLYSVDPRLGGQSETIHQRVIFKLYGREAGASVIEQLYTSPATVIPVLFHRLLEVRERWKAAQRQWNDVWRQQVNANYHKAYDSQAANSKALNDKRQFQLKTILQEIRAKQEDSKAKNTKGYVQPVIPGLPDALAYQYIFKMTNTETLLDAARIVLTYVDHHHSPDYPQLVRFLKELFSLFFGIDQSLFKSAIEDDESLTSEDSPATDNASSPRPKGGRKRRGLLHSVLDKTKASAPGSRDSTPDVTPTGEDDSSSIPAASSGSGRATPRGDKWFHHPSMGIRGANVSPDEVFDREQFYFYANGQIVAFFRLFGQLYERLEAIQEHEADAKELVDVQKLPKPAYDLNMIAKPPQYFFKDIGDDASYYKQMLVMFEDHMRGLTDQAFVEETLRRYYLDSGYRLYNIEKHVAAMAKFGTSLVTTGQNDKSHELYQLFKKDRVKDKSTIHEDQVYRKQADKYLAPKEREGESSYRIAYVSPRFTPKTSRSIC
jgi:paired amphipathic helix protein Sin3a